MNRKAAARGVGRAVSPRPERSRRRTDVAAVAEITEVSLPQAGLPVEATHDSDVAQEGRPRLSFLSAMGVNRLKLQAEMIEMRERYLGGASEAATNLERFETLSRRAKTLLDEEFPGWESEPEERRSDMVTLYFQYRADAERAAEIQGKFERLTRDIELLLNEEFPDWQGQS